MQNPCDEGQADKFIPEPPAAEIQDDEDHGDRGMDDQRGVGSAIARMHFAKPGGHVGIEPGDKRDAGGAAEPSGSNASDRKTQHDGEWRDDPSDSDAGGHMADGLNDALKNIDIAFADGDEQRQRRADVEQTGEDTAPGDGAGKSLLGIFDFVAHDGREFETDEAEADHAEGIQHEFRIVGNLKVGPGHGGAEAEPDDDAEADEDHGGDSCADGAEIVDPFSNAKANDVQAHENNQQREGSRECKHFVVAQGFVTGTERENGNADEVEHDRRDVHHVVGPIAPAGEEAVEVAEDFLGPEIDAAFAGIAVGKFDHGNALRPEKKDEGN